MKRTVALLSFALAAVAAHAGLLAGSDLVGPALAPALTRSLGEAAARDFRGSLDGIRDLRAGRAAVALVFIREEEIPSEVTKGEWVAAPVAYQPIYVSVHMANKAGEIDLATLGGLFGDSPDIRYDTWECLPAAGLTQAPFAILTTPGKGLTASQFRFGVLGGGRFKRTVRFADGNDTVENRAVSSPNCIALTSRPPTTGNLKVLAIADGRPGRSNRAYLPTASNLHSGDYPLRVTLYALWSKAGKKEAAPLAKVVLSQEAAKLLTEKGLAPAPENIRKKFEQSLDS